MKEDIHDLLEIIHFTERISAKIHGVLDENTIYQIVKKESIQSKKYAVSILLLTDESTLTIVETFIPPQTLKEVEKATGLTLKGYTINVESPVYHQVVKEGKTVQVPVDHLVSELVLQPVSSTVSEMLGYKGKSAILTPLKRHEEIIGALAVSSTELAEYFIPSVKSLAQHISAALELSREYFERKRTEEQLQKSEEKFRALFENQGIGVALGELDIPPAGETFLMEANAALLQFLGYTQEEFSTKTVADLSHPEDMKKDSALMNEVLKGVRDSYEIEKRFFRKDGQIVWGLATVSVLRDAEGNPTHAICSVQDITERKKAEEQLHYQANLLENVSDAVISTDLNFVIKTWNKAAETMYNWKAHEVIGKTTDKVLKTEAYYNRKEDAQKEFLKKGYWKGEVIQKKKDGTPLNVFSSATLIKDSTKTPVGAIAINRDITEQKRAEKALKESEEKYKDLVENLNDVIYIIGKNGVITYISPAIESFMSYTPQEMIGNNFSEFVCKEDLPGIEENFLKVLSGHTATNEYRAVGKSGDIQWIRTSSWPVVVGDHVTGVQGVLMDITEQKKAEKALKWELSVNNSLSKLYKPLISPSSIEEIATTILDHAKQLTNSEQGYVSSIDPETGACIAHTLTKMLDQCSVPPENKRIVFLPKDGHYPGLWGHSLNTREPFFTNSPEMHPDIQRIPEGHIRVQTFLSVPVLLGNELVGQIALANKKGGYTERDLDAICRFADVYAVAIQRMRAEEKLRESEEKFRDIAERNFDAIFELDTKGCITYISPAIERIIDYNPQEMMGTPLLAYVSEFSVSQTQQAYMNLLEGNSVEGFQVKALKKDESSALVEINASPIIKEGIITGIQGVARDITERKKAETKLRESEEKYRTLVEQSLQGIAIAQGMPPRLVFVNTAFAEMSGYTVEELLSFSHDVTDILAHPEDHVMCSTNYIARIAGKPAPSRYEFRLMRKDKNVRWLELLASCIEYEGSPAVQAAFMDITERKKAEKQIKQSLREKEVLLREIHHRVKNNLQVISSLLNLQADHIKDRTYQGMLKESQNRIKSMALIHEKLYQSENLADIDFEEYITSLVYGLVRSYNVMEKVTPTIKVDKVSLGIDAAIPCGLIINELVSNSLKYAFPGDRTGEITIQLHSTGNTVELVVADNGVGIPDTIDFRNTQTLGLDLVTTLAEEQLDGEIMLDKTKETAFRITFEVV